MTIFLISTSSKCPVWLLLCRHSDHLEFIYFKNQKIGIYLAYNVTCYLDHRQATFWKQFSVRTIGFLWLITYDSWAMRHTLWLICYDSEDENKALSSFHSNDHFGWSLTINRSNLNYNYAFINHAIIRYWHRGFENVQMQAIK